MTIQEMMEIATKEAEKWTDEDLWARIGIMRRKLEEMDEGREKMEVGIAFGQLCYNLGAHMEAVDAYRDVFDAIPFDCPEELKPLQQKAIEGLWALHDSPNEYAWERTGVLFDYMDWCEENNK